VEEDERLVERQEGEATILRKPDLLTERRLFVPKGLVDMSLLIKRKWRKNRGKQLQSAWVSGGKKNGVSKHEKTGEGASWGGLLANAGQMDQSIISF